MSHCLQKHRHALSSSCVVQTHRHIIIILSVVWVLQTTHRQAIIILWVVQTHQWCHIILLSSLSHLVTRDGMLSSSCYLYEFDRHIVILSSSCELYRHINDVTSSCSHLVSCTDTSMMSHHLALILWLMRGSTDTSMWHHHAIIILWVGQAHHHAIILWIVWCSTDTSACAIIILWVMWVMSGLLLGQSLGPWEPQGTTWVRWTNQLTLTRLASTCVIPSKIFMLAKRFKWW
jgi:hypothetical protein